MTAPLYPLGAFGEQTGFVIIFFVGLAFGFFLERAGFGSARKLADIFYFRDFAVLRVMFTAIVVAMIGLVYMASTGWIQMDAVAITPTFLGAQIAGGLLLGIGFIIGGYCPGTSVVAAASGKLDGVLFVAGLVFGNALFGFGFGWIEPLYSWGARGVVTLPEWAGLSAGHVSFAIAMVAVAAFAATEWADSRKGRKTEMGGFTMNVSWQRAGAGALVVGAFVLMVAHSMARDNGRGDLARLVAAGQDQIGAAELAGWIAQSKPALVVDLRDPESYGQYHIPGAVNVRFEQLNAFDVPKDRPVVLCSVDGARAGQAWAVLAARGVESRILTGGLRQWWAEVATPADLRIAGGPAGSVTQLASPRLSPAKPEVPPPANGGGSAPVKKFRKAASCS